MTGGGARGSEPVRPALGRRFLEELIFAFDGSRRFTQDSPVLPDVWLYYGCEDPLGALDLLLTPHRGTRAGELARRLRTDRVKSYREDHPERLWIGGERAPHRIAYTHANVAARLYFEELVRVVLPMTSWWRGVLADQSKVEGWEDVGPGAGKAGRAKGGKRLSSVEAARARLREPAVRRAMVEVLEVVLDLARARAGGRRAEPPRQGLTPPGVRAELFWMSGVIGVVAWAVRYAAGAEAEDGGPRSPNEGEGCEVHLDAAEVLDALDELLDGTVEYPRAKQRGGRAAAEPPADLGPAELELVYLVNRNRPAGTAVADSGPAIKADAARLLFNVDCSRLAWAVIDSGVDATHPAFTVRDDDHRACALDQSDRTFSHRSRVVKTYDFTRLRSLLDPDRLDPDAEGNALPAHVAEAIARGEAPRAKLADRRRAERLRGEIAALRELLDRGRDLDWALFEDLLEMPHAHPHYRVPDAAFDHGTHVAGILAADWWDEQGESDAPKLRMKGICPDLRLYDLRVLGPPPETAAGADADADFSSRGGEEFVVIAALQFVRYLNEAHDHVVVHGVNLSLSINHDIANYACGRTPVCEECERLVDAGVVVVAAAGNQGYLRYQTHEGFKEGYHTISITDPGNAEAVITVGATHRDRPHTYGVSYFSSRGPTGDGRAKPDLVAPGEKITAPLPGASVGKKDGTSMAAPHVSGAAALLMARHDELVGRPRRVKELICSTATDLGRERYFQGAGMLDVLRAMQAH